MPNLIATTIYFNTKTERKEAHQKAQSQDMSLSQLVRMLIRDYQPEK